MATKTFTYSGLFTEKYVDQGRAEGEAKGRAEGRAAEAAEAVRRVLAARGIVVSTTSVTGHVVHRPRSAHRLAHPRRGRRHSCPLSNDLPRCGTLTRHEET